MNDQDAAVTDVLGGFVDLTADHPAAVQLREAVAAKKAAEAVGIDEAVEWLGQHTPTVVIESIPACIIRPGDVIVLTVDHAFTHAMADMVKAELFKKLPGITDVVVLSGLHVSGVYREDVEP